MLESSPWTAHVHVFQHFVHNDVEDVFSVPNKTSKNSGCIILSFIDKE